MLELALVEKVVPIKPNWRAPSLAEQRTFANQATAVAGVEDQEVLIVAISTSRESRPGAVGTRLGSPSDRQTTR